jgi:Tol biopolymer transport system component
VKEVICHSRWSAIGVALTAFVVVGTSASAVRTDVASPRRAHLVFVSDRDGDSDVYAAEPSGTRLSALTRNERDERLVYSRDGRRLAVLRFGKRAWQVFLLSADGRRERRVATGSALVSTPEAFSPDGARLAISLRRGQAENYWDAVAVATGNGRMQVLTPDHEDYRFADWSPDGRSLLMYHVAYENGNERTDLVVGGLASGPPRVLASDVSGSGATWGSAGRIAFLKGHPAPTELHLLDPADPRSDMIVATGEIDLPSPDGRNDDGWSPNGRLLAYTVDREDSSSLHVATLDRTTRRLYGNGEWVPKVAWSPRSDAVALETSRGLVVIGVDGRVRSRLRQPNRDVEAIAWSPDATRLALLVADTSAVNGLWVATAANGRARRLTRRGNVKSVSWVPGRVPAKAIRARPVVPTERTTATSLYARARISEISASGNWVAAIVETNRWECSHIVAWRPETRSLVGFDTPAPCDFRTAEYYQLRLTGTRLRWTDHYCGLSTCYTIGVAADLGGPGKRSWATSDERPTRRTPQHPAASRETRGGVTMLLERGTIVLRRAGGRVRRIRPPGGAIDAELEQTGLFYAFGRRHASRVVFIPYDRLYS